MSTPVCPRIFISYTHDSQEHKDKVLDLANKLRVDGLECTIDQYEISPAQGWPKWMLDQIESANFVLVVATEKYNQRFRGKDEKGKGKGAKWEGAVITQELYDTEQNVKFIPITFSAEDTKFIPGPVKGATYYDLSGVGTYDDLYRHLTAQPKIVPPAVGTIRMMAPKPSTAPVATPPSASASSTVNTLADVDLIRFYAQCFDRPAFQDPFAREGSVADFDKAVEDTITAINTGCLRSRDGAELARAKGKTFLSNASWREKMDQVVQELRTIRDRFRRAVSLGQITNMGHGSGAMLVRDASVVRWMDEHRTNVINTFNKICRDAGIPPLQHWH